MSLPKKILILCQRKYSDKENELVQSYITSIKNYTSKLYPNTLIQYTYLSECLSKSYDGNNCADYIFEFNPQNNQTLEFIFEYKKYFDTIILHQCPVYYFNPFTIYALTKILKPSGQLHIISLWRDNIDNNTLHIYRTQNFNDKLSEFYLGLPNFIEKENQVLETNLEQKLENNTEEYDQWPVNVREILKCFFIWNNIENIPYLELKNIPNKNYISYLINYFCENIKEKYIKNLFISLEYPIQMYFKKVAKYCLLKNKGNVEYAKIILRMPIF